VQSIHNGNVKSGLRVLSMPELRSF
jgi:hypothetical protein